jgi:ribosomal protein S12 methylthiotransferase
VEGASANALPGPVPEAVKEERRARFMAVQAGISERLLQRKVGRVLDVLIDQVDGGGGAVGRSSADAPEIDGTVILEDVRELKVGDFARVRVTSAGEHDLHAHLA